MGYKTPTKGKESADWCRYPAVGRTPGNVPFHVPSSLFGDVMVSFFVVSAIVTCVGVPVFLAVLYVDMKSSRMRVKSSRTRVTRK